MMGHTVYGPEWHLAIAITIGGGREFTIMEHPSEKPDLVLRARATGYCQPLGKATKKRIEELQEYLERLKVHAE